VMVPVPAWLIEGSEKTILIDTGLGDIDEVSQMQSRYGVDFLASRSTDQDLVAGLAPTGRAEGHRHRGPDAPALRPRREQPPVPRAQFVVQPEELPQAVAPRRSACSTTRVLLQGHRCCDRLRVIDGDVDIADGVRLERRSVVTRRAAWSRWSRRRRASCA
jgi:hypothetical protein